ncbi:hypothetical protein N7512_005480 [Penicillium capsulatum]|nr:hypothetical protein N7512_005480 [Penicillium capsulatum]
MAMLCREKRISNPDEYTRTDCRQEMEGYLLTVYFRVLGDLRLAFPGAQLAENDPTGCMHGGFWVEEMDHEWHYSSGAPAVAAGLVPGADGSLFE